jgi:hypothetical protein
MAKAVLSSNRQPKNLRGVEMVVRPSSPVRPNTAIREPRVSTSDPGKVEGNVLKCL